jgi:hypothetical protein
VGDLFAHVQWKRSFRDVDLLMRELDFRYERRLAAVTPRPGPHSPRAIKAPKAAVKVNARGKSGRVDVVYRWDDDEYRDGPYRWRD